MNFRESKRSRRSFVATIGCLPFVRFPNAFADLKPNTPKGLRVFTCGHSFHVWVAPILADLAEKAGIADHKLAGVSSIGGSRVVQHWNVADGKNSAKKALAAKNVDVLTLSPIWLPDEGIESFVRYGVEHNPDLRILVQEYWLPNDEYNPVYPLDTKKKVDHNAVDLSVLREANARYERDIEAHVREINTRLGKESVFVVPVGAASIVLREQIVAGKHRILKVQWRLFRDDWGHPTVPLKVLAAYCFFAAIYQRSPIGLPMPKEFEENKEFAIPSLNAALQQIAWEAVSANPMSGLKVEAAIK
jgi:hypothetical protein